MVVEDIVSQELKEGGQEEHMDVKFNEALQRESSSGSSGEYYDGVLRMKITASMDTKEVEKLRSSIK